jgi:hypothetical protein
VSLSIKEQIVQEFCAIIGRVGWVQNVQRINQVGLKWADTPFVIVTQGDDLLEAIQTRPWTTRRADLIASIVTRITDAAEVRSADEILNGYGSDLEAAVMGDLTVRGLAVEIKPPDWLEMEIESDVPSVGVALRFGVVYRHLRHDPYRQE